MFFVDDLKWLTTATDDARFRYYDHRARRYPLHQAVASGRVDSVQLTVDKGYNTKAAHKERDASSAFRRDPGKTNVCMYVITYIPSLSHKLRSPDDHTQHHRTGNHNTSNQKTQDHKPHARPQEGPKVAVPNGRTTTLVKKTAQQPDTW